jgi:hypothetical protein
MATLESGVDQADMLRTVSVGARAALQRRGYKSVALLSLPCSFKTFRA